MSALLFHGPGAQDEAHAKAEEGRLLAPPFEPDKGLKTDDMREIVGLMSSRVIGNKVGVVLLGPVDNIHPSASDVILKSLEDHNPDYILPILWARDAEEVRPTIRSRCHLEWCPYGQDTANELSEEARSLCKACLKGDWSTVITTVLEHKGQERQLLESCSLILSGAKGHIWIPLWLSIRKALLRRNLSKAEILSALMGGGR